MSFMNKAKQKIVGVPRILGEETVRIVNYKDEEEDSEPEETAVREPKPKPAPKPKPEPKMKKISIPRPPAVKAPVKETKKPSESPVFNLEDKPSFFNKKKKGDAADKAASELVISDQNKIKDVLEILEIPVTFEIGRDTFLPEDIAGLEFDYQTPHGYDIGQVGAFVEQTKSSIKSYVKLLKLRNEHIAKLATVVDRPQVDLNNQRFDTEIANGINIMPTQDDGDLANENMELKLLVMRLKEELKSLQDSDDLSTSERQAFEDLQDQLSIVNRENERLDEEVYELRTKVSFMEEDLGVDPVENEKSFENSDSSSFSDDGYSNQTESSSYEELPVLETENFQNFEETSNGGYGQVSGVDSAFFTKEDLTLDEFILENKDSYEEDSEEDDGDFSMIEILDEKPSVHVESNSNSRSISLFEEDDDDDDALEKIMKQEFGGK